MIVDVQIVSAFALNITYYHDLRQGDCCAWNGTHTTFVQCSFNSTILLAEASTYLNVTDVWVHDHSGAWYDSSPLDDNGVPFAYQQMRRNICLERINTQL
jgi:hypothetical protein